MELFEAIIVSLETLAESDRQIAENASAQLIAIQNSGFFISLLVCENLLSFTLNLSLYLQDPGHDKISALDYSKNGAEQLKDIREEADENFKMLFESASKMAKHNFDCEIRVPCVASKQMHRNNTPFKTA